MLPMWSGFWLMPGSSATKGNEAFINNARRTS